MTPFSITSYQLVASAGAGTPHPKWGLHCQQFAKQGGGQGPRALALPVSRVIIVIVIVMDG